MWNIFKVNNKNDVVLVLLLLTLNNETYFTPFSDVSSADFEHVNGNWVIILTMSQKVLLDVSAKIIRQALVNAWYYHYYTKQ